MSQSAVANLASSNALDTVSFQQLQTFYHKVTGKKEQLRKSYMDPYQITFKDLEDLHHKIIQAAEPYPVTAKNENITLTYNDNSRPVHSSFERFKAQADNGNTALKSVTLEYNFAISTTQSDDVNHYKIIIDVISGIAVFSEIQEEVPKIFWQGVRYQTGKAKIEYVDYAIAQNFMNVITGWFNGRTQAPKRKLLDWVQTHSHYLPKLTKVTFLVLSTLAILQSVGTHIILSDNSNLAKFVVAASSTIWLFTEIGFLIGKAIERSVDQIWKIAYVNLNEGDRKLAEKVREHNKSCFLSICYKIASFVALAFVSILLKDLLAKLVGTI